MSDPADRLRQQWEESKKRKEERQMQEEETRKLAEAFQEAQRQAQQEALRTGQQQQITHSVQNGQVSFGHQPTSDPGLQLGIQEGARGVEYQTPQQITMQARREEARIEAERRQAAAVELANRRMAERASQFRLAQSQAEREQKEAIRISQERAKQLAIERGDLYYPDPTNPFRLERREPEPEVKEVYQGVQPFIERPEKDDPVEAFTGYFRNIGEFGASGAGLIREPDYRPEVEGGIYSALFNLGKRAIEKQPVEMQLTMAAYEFGDIGKFVQERPLYAVGSLAATTLFTLGTLGAGPAVRGAKVAATAVQTRRTASSMGRIIQRAEAASEPIKINIEPKTGFINIGTEGQSSRFGVGQVKPSGKVEMFMRETPQALKKEEMLVPPERVTAYTRPAAQVTTKTGETLVDVGHLPKKLPPTLKQVDDVLYEQTQVIADRDPVWLKVPVEEKPVAVSQTFTRDELAKIDPDTFLGIEQVGSRPAPAPRPDKPMSPFGTTQVTRETVQKIMKGKEPPKTITPLGLALAPQMSGVRQDQGGIRITDQKRAGRAGQADYIATGISLDFLATPAKSNLMPAQKHREMLDTPAKTAQRARQQEVQDVGAIELPSFGVSEKQEPVGKLGLFDTTVPKMQFDLVPRLGTTTRTRTTPTQRTRTIPTSTTKTIPKLTTKTIPVPRRTPVKTPTIRKIPPVAIPKFGTGFPKVKLSKNNILGGTEIKKRGVKNIAFEAFSIPENGKGKRRRKWQFDIGL